MEWEDVSLYREEGTESLSEYLLIMEMVLGDSGVFIQEVREMERGAGWLLGADGHMAERSTDIALELPYQLAQISNKENTKQATLRN